MTPDKAIEKASAVLRQHGMRVSKQCWADKALVWDGKTLFIGGVIRGMAGTSEALDAPVMLHELGHYLTAPYKWRNKPEYGLGTAPFASHWGAIERLRPGTDDGWEEDCAYILGLAWAVELGINIEPIIKRHHILMDGDHIFMLDFDDSLHDWRGLDRFWRVIEHLNARGLLSGNQPVPHAKKRRVTKKASRR